MTRNPATFGGILALLAALAVVSCHPLDEGNGENPPVGSIVGVWTISESVPPGFDARCIPPLNPYLLYVAQNGSAITAQTGVSQNDASLGSNGALFTGTLDGSTLAIQAPPGGNPHLAGALQTARFATVSGACGALTGVRTMAYIEQGQTLCSGVLNFTGIRSIGSDCAGTLAATAVVEAGVHDTQATAQLVTRPAEISGTIAMGAEDWYQFDLVATAPVTIMLNGPAAPANIDLFLTDNVGAALTPAVTSTSGSSREAVAKLLTGPATYKVRVVGTTLASQVSYTLLIQ